MKEIKAKARWQIYLLFLFFLLGPELWPQGVRVKVIADNASIKITPEIGGQTLANISLGTILSAEAKQGEWYKVFILKEGVEISGYIHEILVEEVKDEEVQQPAEPAGAGKSQAEILAEIDLKLEECRNLIRQEKEPEKALNDLRPLVARAFNVEDRKKQKEVASEIYLWLGLAFTIQRDGYNALKEFRNMFEVDYENAKAITRNIYDPEVITFIQQAEKQFQGLAVEFELQISTEPKDARIKINGREIGLSPEIFRTELPKLTIEIEKDGYKPIKEDLVLIDQATQKEYRLEKMGRPVFIASHPAGARIILDGQDTGQVTDHEFPIIPFGAHRFRIEKGNYAVWEDEVQIKEDSGSFTVEAFLTGKNYSFFHKWGGPEIKFFKLPKGIALDQEDNFYVVDESDRKLKKFDAEGKFSEAWGDGGKEFKSLKEPAGLAADSEGNLYVTDAKNHCLFKFDREGRLVSKWGKKGIGADEFQNPLGVAVDSRGDVYVADAANHRLKKYSSQGIVKDIWATKGTATGDFILPAAVAVSRKDEIFIVDSMRIQKFTPEGEFILDWSKPGLGEGEINYPMGIFIDRFNYVYLADSANNRIQKFDDSGKLIATWGAPGKANGQMMFPFGVAVDSRGYVFVVERDNHRVQAFRVLSD